MKLKKYEHACFTIEKDGQVLVVDPGVFTKDFVITDNIIGIVVTHEHPDHFDPDMLAAIYAKNPDSLLISTAEVVEKMVDHTAQIANSGESLSVGAFTLKFFGSKHATIHTTLPVVDNFGVFIDDVVYFPGDSFTLPNLPVPALALPVGAPWLKISEVMDFYSSVRPRFAFPTHDALFSTIGKSLADGRMQSVAESMGLEYRRIDGQTIEL